MRAPGNPRVDQLLVLLAVVEEGSFTGAARRLRRATSAISYAIDTLEAQLGLTLFDRGTTRKPKLTRVGEAIVSEAKAVAHSVETLRARVRGLLDGLESGVSLVADSMYPSDQLVAVLDDFHAAFPTVPLRLSVQPLQAVVRVVRGGDGWIGVGGIVHMDITGLQVTQIGGIRIIPVAAPDHPLALAGRTSRSREHIQLVLSDQPAPQGRDHGVVSLTTWRIGDQAVRHKLLVAGIGWGGMPESVVRADIGAGRLVRLDLPNWRGGEYAMQVVHKVETPPGPAGRWLIERLAVSSRISENAQASPLTRPSATARPSRPPRVRRRATRRSRSV